MPHILLGARHVSLRQGPLFSSILGQSSGFKPAVPLLPHAVLIWPWHPPRFALSTIIRASSHTTNWSGAPSSLPRRVSPSPSPGHPFPRVLHLQPEPGTHQQPPQHGVSSVGAAYTTADELSRLSWGQSQGRREAQTPEPKPSSGPPLQQTCRHLENPWAGWSGLLRSAEGVFFLSFPPPPAPIPTPMEPEGRGFLWYYFLGWLISHFHLIKGRGEAGGGVVKGAGRGGEAK